MQTFTIRELRERSDDLSREAEDGRLALVTRRRISLALREQSLPVHRPE
ncbi:hypothetical protein [Cupriavidus consociatus]|nr:MULTISPECIES: hypothetical protein [unclassified Cupriavidus]MBP0622888.1 hypothetical protein [Cupriavidus sp. LEh25]MDK2659574.1 hypothetical protein [Cupriavidus sp. LEh21]